MTITVFFRGDVFVENFDLLRAYVEFCSKQQAALEKLNELEHNSVSFRQVTSFF